MEILPNFSWVDTQILKSSIKKDKMNRVNYKKILLNQAKSVSYNFTYKQEKTKKREM